MELLTLCTTNMELFQNGNLSPGNLKNITSDNPVIKTFKAT